MRHLDLTLPGIAENLALDEALLVAAEERGAGGSLRIWEPDHVAVVLGASCRRAEDVWIEVCRAEGIPLARRSSGGGTVVVGPGTLNVTVVLAADAAPGLGAVDLAHAYVLDRLARSIRARGPAVEVLGLGDLTLDGRKFSGSAQRRLRGHFLVHASILYAFPLDRISRYTKAPSRQPAYRAGRSHEDFVVNVPLPRPVLVEAVREAWLPPGRPVDPMPVPDDLVRDLLATKFADPAWIERL